MNSADARHSVSVAGVITDDHGRALLIQRRDNQRWEPPGGVLEPGETIYDGLRREVREETGLEVEPIALTGVYKNMNPYRYLASGRRGHWSLAPRTWASTGGPPREHADAKN